MQIGSHTAAVDMHPPAVAAQASLLSAFDVVGAQASAGRRVGGSAVGSAATDAPADPFGDLLDGALTGVPILAAEAQPIVNVAARAPVDPAAQLSTTGVAALTESSELASLMAASQQAGRMAVPSGRPALTSVVAATSPAAPGDSSGLTVTSGTQRAARQAAQRTLSTADEELGASARDARSLRRADASHLLRTATVLGAPIAPSDLGTEFSAARSAESAISSPPQVSSAQAAATALGVMPMSTGIGAPDARWQAAGAVNVDDQAGLQPVDPGLPATDAQELESDQSFDGLRPASDLVQDVQTVPQPESPAGSMPAVITTDRPLVTLNAAAGAMMTVDGSSDLDARLRSETEAATLSGATADGRASESSGTHVGPAGRFMPGIEAADSEVGMEPIASLHAVRPSLDDHSLEVRTKGAGSDGAGAAATTGESLSATAVNAQVTEPASTGSSVVRQISEAVQTWRDALQEQGTARFSAWLTPPDLGHVWVELTRSAGGITARLSASDDDVQSLLETQEPELRQALADSGIAVTELDVFGRSAGDAASQQQQPPPDHREESKSPAVRVVPQPPRRPAPARTNAVDVRA